VFLIERVDSSRHASGIGAIFRHILSVHLGFLDAVFDDARAINALNSDCNGFSRMYDRRIRKSWLRRREVCKALFAIVLTLTVATTILGKTKYDFQAGKLVNITTDERLYEGTTSRWAVFTVQLADLVYTARGDRLRRGSGDPGEGMIVGVAVQVAIDGENLIFRKPDGKELKTKIVKRARAQ
jgi:hypothetical protein